MNWKSNLLIFLELSNFGWTNFGHWLTSHEGSQFENISGQNFQICRMTDASVRKFVKETESSTCGNYRQENPLLSINKYI